MSQVHSCGFLASEVMFSIERIKEHAGNRNADAAKSHLSIVEKELQTLGVYCELGGTGEERQHVENIRDALNKQNWGVAQSESLELEKGMLLKQARNHNNGGDPLDVITSRTWDALK